MHAQTIRKRHFRNLCFSQPPFFGTSIKLNKRDSVIINFRYRCKITIPQIIFAEIYDFIVLPNIDNSGEKAFKKLVFRELKRVMDFVRLAANRNQCEKEAQEIADEYDIDLREV